MRLIANWRAVLKNAWSVRLIVIAGILSGAEIALPLLQDSLPIPRMTFAALSACATCGALIARLVAQKSISGDEE